MRKFHKLCLTACFMAPAVEASEYWGLTGGYSEGFHHHAFKWPELPDMPIEVPSQQLSARDWADFIGCGDMLSGLARTSYYKHPVAQFFYRIDNERISVFTPYFAGTDRLHCQPHTFGIKYRETSNVCYMAIPYQSPLRRKQTWGYFYTASAIDSWWNARFATGGPFSFFHEVEKRIDFDASHFPDEVIQPRSNSTNFMNQKKIPFQMHPRAQHLWGPNLTLDPEAAPLFIRNLTQMAAIADPQVNTGDYTTLDHIDEGLERCASVSAKVGLKALPKAIAELGTKLKPRILEQRAQNALVSMEIKPIRRNIGPKEILMVEATISNGSKGPFDTDGSECGNPVWSVDPKGYFSEIHDGECQPINPVGLGLGGGKNLTPTEDKVSIDAGVVRSFIVYLRVNEFVKPGLLKFSMTFGRRNPIRSSPQSIVIRKEEK